MMAGPHVIQLSCQLAFVHAHVRQHHRNIGRRCPGRPSELADPVHGVMVVEREQEPVAHLERIRFANQLERMAGIGREDHGPGVGRRVEKPEHGPPRPLDLLGRPG